MELKLLSITVNVAFLVGIIL